MENPAIRFKGNVLGELEDQGISETEARKYINDAIRDAEKIAKLGLDSIDAVCAKPRGERIDAWKRNNKLITYFGNKSLSLSQIRGTQRRLSRAHRRLATKKLTVRVFSQGKAPSSTTNAQNLGSIFSPKTFKIFSRWFTKNGPLQRAGIILHELQHDLFPDQKLNGISVYGETLAKELASKKPVNVELNINWRLGIPKHRTYLLLFYYYLAFLVASRYIHYDKSLINFSALAM